ncbi:MAG: IS200/IS605 family transposase [Planctomycetes bacterium]|nr:IS200/IS605 family transposase [Planctomycetota bacterium]
MPSTYTNLLYHIVFSTKQRLPLITADLQDELYKYIGGIIRAEGGVLLEIGGITDHIHLLTKFKPSKSISEMLNRIKANSSKWVNQEKIKPRRFGWQEGYSAFTVSESQVSTVKEYIRNQEQHHRQQSFKEELVVLLERHGVSYDEQYLWN